MAAEQRLRLEDYTVGSLPTLIYIPNFITESDQSQLLHHIYGVPSPKWKSLKNRRLQNWGGVVHEKGLLPQDLPPWLTKITQRICQETGLFPSAINHVLINEYLPDQGIMPHQDGPAYFPVVAILSLGSPVVIDFTPHTRLKDCKDIQGNTPEHMTDGGAAAEAYSSDLSNEIVCTSEDAQHPRSLLLMPCSLLIFKDQAYSEYLHGIKDSDLHDLGKVVNVSEYLKECLKQDTKSTCSLDSVVESNICQMKTLHRTSPRVSLTCRLVLKVHKKLFKF